MEGNAEFLAEKAGGGQAVHSEGKALIAEHSLQCLRRVEMLELGRLKEGPTQYLSPAGSQTPGQNWVFARVKARYPAFLVNAPLGRRQNGVVLFDSHTVAVTRIPPMNIGSRATSCLEGS